MSSDLLEPEWFINFKEQIIRFFDEKPKDLLTICGSASACNRDAISIINLLFPNPGMLPETQIFSEDLFKQDDEELVSFYLCDLMSTENPHTFILMTWKEEGEDYWTILQSFINKFTIQEYLKKTTKFLPIFFSTSFIKRKSEYPLYKLSDIMKAITKEDYKNLFLNSDLKDTVGIRNRSVSIRKYGEIKKEYLSNIKEIVSKEIFKMGAKKKSIRLRRTFTKQTLFDIKHTLNYPLYFSIYNGIATLILPEDSANSKIKLGVIGKKGDISDGIVNIKDGINTFRYNNDDLELNLDILSLYKKPLGQGRNNSTKGKKNSTKGRNNSTKGRKNSTKGRKNSTKGKKNSTKGKKNSTKGKKNSIQNK